MSSAIRFRTAVARTITPGGGWMRPMRMTSSWNSGKTWMRISRHGVRTNASTHIIAWRSWTSEVTVSLVNSCAKKVRNSTPNPVA